ncbi:MAG: phage major capsid protein [Deltaproteobacteria bacterium]|nr:phage major capsid protein [Deltaproteobacteria bacterium]
MVLKHRKADLIKEARGALERVRRESRDLTEEEKERDEQIIARLDSLNDGIHREELQLERERDIPRTLVEEKKFKSLGEQLQAVRTASATNMKSIDPRLLQIKAATGMGEVIPSDGGFLVQTDFATEILRKIHEVGVLSSRVLRIPISGNANGLRMPFVDEKSRIDGSRWGGVQGFWVGEGVAPTKSKPKMGRVELELKKLAGLVYMTEELMADAAALEAFVTMAVTEELGFKLDDAIYRGDGNAKPLGILSSDAPVSVAKESGQTLKTIVYENLIKMWARLTIRSRANAVWFINQDCDPQLDTLSLAVGTSGIPARFVVDGPDGVRRIKGAPVIPIEYCETLGTKGDIMLADMSQYLMIEKGGIQSVSSIHVKFEEGETAFRFILRTDGQPAWQKPLTPFKGTNTVSPFVLLDTRA